MCAFDYQLYSDTRRIREKMSLVYVSTHDKTFFLFVRSYVRTFAGWLVSWLLAWLVRWLADVDCCCIYENQKGKEPKRISFGFVCSCVYKMIRAGVETEL